MRLKVVTTTLLILLSCESAKGTKGIKGTKGSLMIPPFNFLVVRAFIFSGSCFHF
jgi:hypothetical protein